MIWVT